MSRAEGALVSTQLTAQRNAMLENEVKVDMDLYGKLLSRAREAGFEKELSAPQLDLVSPASVEMEPVRPRPLINLLVCLAAGLLVGTGFTLAREAGRRTVRDPEDVERQLDLPVLAVLPKTA
jgi:tyrosine-protein kinase Etk/Wzc